MLNEEKEFLLVVGGEKKFKNQYSKGEEEVDDAGVLFKIIRSYVKRIIF